MFAPIDPAKATGLYEAMMGGARPRIGTPPFAPDFAQTGGANAPTTPETMPVKRGFAGFIDRMLNPSNSLGQFGQALLAGTGGPLGGAMAHIIQQRAAAGKGDRDSAQWQRQYDYERTNPKPSTAQPYRWERNDGSVMELDAGTGQPRVLYEDPNKRVDWQKLDNGDGTFTMVPVPFGGGPSAPSPAPQSLGNGDKPDWSKMGGGVRNGTPTFPVSGGVLDRVTAQGESGNRDYHAPGRPVVSPKGARFAMQVMPETARDPGFGLKPANPNDPADMNRLGREYRAVMERRGGGDLRKMWAAYNMGPGALDKLIATHGENGWFAHAPQETRDYIRRNLANLRSR